MRSLSIGTALLILGVAVVPATASPRILIVMDERPQMEVLASFLKQKGGIEATIVDQKALPEDWKPFDAVLAYIHGALLEPTELKLIEYTKSGGRYVCIHHSISSGKVKNKYYFDFLGVRLDDADQARQPATPGTHYAWREPVDMTLVNLNAGHYITSHDVTWPEKTTYRSSEAPEAPEREYPALTVKDVEAYMNVKFTDGHDKTVLLGFKYRDDRNGALYMQDREGWLKPAGKGWVVYLQMGHSAKEFENPAVAQMVMNAITWRPEQK
jgi:hypothetical protein